MNVIEWGIIYFRFAVLLKRKLIKQQLMIVIIMETRDWS